MKRRLTGVAIETTYVAVAIGVALWLRDNPPALAAAAALLVALPIEWLKRRAGG